MKLDAIADISDWNFDWLQVISRKLDDLIDKDVSLDDSTIVTNLSNVRNTIESTNTILSTNLGAAGNSLSSIVKSLGTIGGFLSNGSGSVVQAAQSALTSLSSISSRLISGDMGAASWLNRISSQLGSLSSIVTMLSPGGLTNSQIANIITSLGGSGSIASRLSTSNTHLGNLVTLLGSDGLTGTQLSNIITELSGTGPIASRVGSLVQMLSSGGIVNSQLVSLITELSGEGPIASRVSTSNTHLGNLVKMLSTGGVVNSQLGNIIEMLSSGGVVNSLISGVIDGLETGSSSIVQQLAQLPGILQSGFSSVVSGLGAIDIPSSITATLSPDATISAETDVAGEAAQSATLWDTIVGDVDTSQIRSQMDSCVGYLRTSFPFGLIFVVVDTLGALSASPVAPVFEADVPAVVGTYHMELDLSYFDSVAALFRGGFVVLYVFGLYSVTKQWVFNAGGDSA